MAHRTPAVRAGAHRRALHHRGRLGAALRRGGPAHGRRGGSICQGDYGSFLDKLIQRAGGPQADFPLTATPNGTAEMTVRVQGRRRTAAWTYDAARNAVVFARRGPRSGPGRSRSATAASARASA